MNSIVREEFGDLGIEMELSAREEVSMEDGQFSLRRHTFWRQGLKKLLRSGVLLCFIIAVVCLFKIYQYFGSSKYLTWK